MTNAAEIRAEAARLRDGFVALGGQVVEADVLLPADTLLDLYGLRRKGVPQTGTRPRPRP